MNMEDLSIALEHADDLIAHGEDLAAIGHLAHGIAHELTAKVDLDTPTCEASRATAHPAPTP